MRLKGKVIFLAGGSEGIGWDCAQAFAREGANVIICARNGEVAKEKALQLNGSIGLRCDVSNEDEVRQALDSIKEMYGRLDVIHNNAGIGSPAKPLHTTTTEEWNMVFDVNIRSVYHTTKYGFDLLKASKGCILNTSSMVGVMGQENHAAYTATKGAMNTLTKSMALDYAKEGIRVNAVCPAGTWTPMLRKWISEQENADEMAQYLDEIHPLGYCPEGDSIAEVATFLISEEARFVTGHIMHVSGGAELGYRRPHP